MFNSTTERIAYHIIRSKNEYYKLVKDIFFENVDLQKIYKIDKSFFIKYKQVASCDQIKDYIKQLDVKNVSENSIDFIFDVDINEYDIEWKNNSIENWILVKTLETSFVDSIEYMKNTKIDVDNAKDVVNKVLEIMHGRNNISFDTNEGINFFDATQHKQPTLDTFTTGYAFLDDCLGGGFEKRSLVVVAGALKSGKSIWCCNIAANGVRNGFNTAYITLELREKRVVKRIGSNLLDVPMDEYDEFAKSVDKVSTKLKTIGKENLKTPGNLIIKEFPASSVGVPEIENYLLKIEERDNMKFNLIVIDYINIMQDWHNPHGDNTYMKIKRISEDLRAMSTRNEWCVFSVTQVNRDGVNNNDLTASNISESMGLGHTVDGLFGIIQDDALRLKNKYILKALALRNAGGMDSKKTFNIDYSYMRINEDSEQHSSTNNVYENNNNVDVNITHNDNNFLNMEI